MMFTTQCLLMESLDSVDTSTPNEAAAEEAEKDDAIRNQKMTLRKFQLDQEDDQLQTKILT